LEPPFYHRAKKIDAISLHPVAGYLVLFAILFATLVVISLFGGWLSGVITQIFDFLNPHSPGQIADILWNGAVVGFYASLSVALGFIFPFYLILGLLGETGYLPGSLSSWTVPVTH
jgi:ferrous iron transport protein B